MAEPVARQLGVQAAASLGLALYTAAASYLCLKATAAVTGGLRVPGEVETAPEGLDGFCFDEHVYTLEEGERLRIYTEEGEHLRTYTDELRQQLDEKTNSTAAARN